MPLPGFSETQETNAIAIYCNNQKASSWYYRENEENIPLPSRLTATILRIEEWTKPAEGKYAEQQKLTIKVSTPEGQNYNLVMGRTSAFAKGLIGTIVNTPLSVLKKPVTISVRPGESALLCSLYSGSDWLEGLKDWKNKDWESLTAQAIEKINSQTSTPMEEETYEYTFDEDDLTGETAEVAPKAIDRNALMKESSDLVKQLGLSNEQCKAYMSKQYFGREARKDLSDDQLLGFVQWLRGKAASSELIGIEDTIAEPLQPKHSAAIKAASSIEELKRILKDIHGDRATLTNPIADQLSATANAKIAQIQKARQEAMTEEIPF